MTRRRLLGLATAAAAIPRLGPLPSARAHAAAHRDLRFRALRHGSPIGEHRVTFRPDGDRLTVETRVDIGDDGPFLASAHLLSSNALWNRGIVRESRLIDVQHGGEIGLVTKQLGDEQVDTAQGRVRASRHHMITPYYAGSVFHDSDGRWVKGVLELKGERVEYALAT